jgi:hypothetical protein
MRRVYYASGSVLTADTIAAAVLSYAETLAKDGRVDIVEIPVVLASGSPGTAVMLLGPSSQLASVTEESHLQPPRDDELIDDLRMRAARLSGSRAVPQTQYADFLSAHEDYE